MARPTKLTPKVHRRLVGLTRAGGFLTSSAPVVGVSRPTVRSWIRRGEAEIARVDGGEPPAQAEQPYAEFARDMMQAKAQANIADMMVIRRAAQHDPVWALRSLKLRHPEWFCADSDPAGPRVSLHDTGVRRCPRP